MSIIRIETVEYFAVCDWCGKREQTINEYTLPPDKLYWIRDWESASRSESNPSSYCSLVHMERARQVAELKALP